jgi:hypothetical protein
MLEVPKLFCGVRTLRSVAGIEPKKMLLASRGQGQVILSRRESSDGTDEFEIAARSHTAL